jgi:hypothetical protein
MGTERWRRDLKALFQCDTWAETVHKWRRRYRAWEEIAVDANRRSTALKAYDVQIHWLRLERHFDSQKPEWNITGWVVHTTRPATFRSPVCPDLGLPISLRIFA